jgi:hypothetical protein
MTAIKVALRVNRLHCSPSSSDALSLKMLGSAWSPLAIH